MSIEEEIAQVIETTRMPSGGTLLASRVQVEAIAAAVMPLVKSAQAEAWEQGFDAAEEDWAHHKSAGWGDEDCIDATFNPYAENEGAGAHD